MERCRGTAAGRYLRRAACILVSAFITGCALTPPMPKVAQSYAERGQAKLAVDRDYSGAIEDFTQAIEFDANNAGAYLGRGMAYMKIGDADSARKDFREAVSLDPGLAPAVKPFQ